MPDPVQRTRCSVAPGQECGPASPAETTDPRIFTPAYYARLNQVEAEHWWYRGIRGLAARWLAAELGGRVGLRVLDVGCGAGFMLRWLERYAAPGPVVGVDLDNCALFYARRQGRGAVARASALDLPFRTGHFDLLHCGDVLQHLPGAGGDAAALAECARVLARGGLLVLRTNAAPGLGGVGDDPHYQRYRLSALEARVTGAGLELLRSTHVNVLPSLVATARRAARRPAGHPAGHRQHGPGLPRMPRLPGLNGALSGVLAAEAALLSLPRVSSPFGHSTLVLARRPG